MNDVYLIIGSYATVILISFGLMNWLSGGYLIPFARTKMSRGRKTLVRVRGISGDHFRIGEIIEGWLVFKDRQGEKRRGAVPDSGYITHAMGVKTIDWDDQTNAVMKADFTVASAYDAIKYENLYVRALTAPKLDDKTMKIILVIVIITLLAVLVSLFMLNKLGGKVDALNQVAAVAQNVV